MAQEIGQEAINQFVIAAHHDLPYVKQTLAEYPQLLNENAEWIETPIQAATHVVNRPIIDYLLAQGAPLDICTAAVLGRADDVRTMLAENPELAHATGAHNIPVLFFPVVVGDLEIAQILLDAGAAVNVEEGANSPLHGAAIFGQAGAARWLLDHDANPYAKDYEGKTPLDRAEASGHEAVTALLKPFFETAD